MTRHYASEKRALGICDRCGFTYLLKELMNETVRGVVTNLRICPECYDPDHPQNQLGQQLIYDPQALQNPRPDSISFGSSRAIKFQLKPVTARVSVGSVTVTTS